MERVRCGVIGLGWFGEHHVDVLKKLPYADLRAVCTRREWRLKEIAERYGVEKTYTDYNDMLADPEIDMVCIVTHVKDHAEPAVAALRAGTHVFLEKPMASTLEECERTVREAERSGRYFMTGHICRFDPVYALTKEEIDSGSVGKILSIHAKRNLARSITDKVLENISALFGDGVHDLGLMLWYTGERVASVYAQTINTRPNLPYDDIGWAMYRLSGGAICVVETIWCLPEPCPFALDAKMEIVGTEGSVYIDNSGGSFTVMTKDGLRYPQATYWPKVHGMRRGYLKEEVDYFLKCVLHGKEPDIITPSESRDVVSAIMMAERSAIEGKVVRA